MPVPRGRGAWGVAAGHGVGALALFLRADAR